MANEQVVVSSSIYNLAGDEESRPDYLKSLIIGGIMQEADSLSGVITSGYQNGPALRFRRFLNWAKRDPGFTGKIGFTNGNLRATQELDHKTIIDNIPLENGEVIDQIDFARIDEANIDYWVLQFLEGKNATGYSYKYDKENNLVIITYSDNSIETFTPVGYVSGAEYLYVRYLPAVPGSEDPPPALGPVTFPPVNFPSLDGWTLHSSSGATTEITLGYRESTRITYSALLPEENYVSNRPKRIDANEYKKLYFRDSFKGPVPWGQDAVYSEREWREHDLSYVAGPWESLGSTTESTVIFIPGVGNITKTTQVTREGQKLTPVRKVREASSLVVHKSWGDPRYFIYRKGSGNADLDELFAAAAPRPAGVFYPPIPFRLDNRPVGPGGLGSKNWWADPGIELPSDSRYYELQLVGGPISRSDPIAAELRAGGTDPDNPTRVVIGSRTVGGQIPDHRLLSLALKGSNPSFRLLTYAAISKSGEDEYTDWMPFLSPPEPVEEGDPSIIALYPTCREAYRQAFGEAQGFDRLQEKILDNKSIDDIDFVYAVFGVSLNVKENACRKYVYNFFKHLMTVTTTYTEAQESAWLVDYQKAIDARKHWLLWKHTTETEVGSGFKEPKTLPFPAVPWQSLTVHTDLAGVSGYRTDIKWAFIHEITSSEPGLLKPGAKAGELWFEILPPPHTETSPFIEGMNPVGFNQRIALCWQETNDTWRKLVITGLHHINYIYKDMVSITSASKALEKKFVFPPGSMIPVEVDGPESPFLIPLHEDVYRQMTMVDATQMATACCFLVFNCYNIHTSEWYESTWFKVIIIIAMVALGVGLALWTGGGSLGVVGGGIFSLLTGIGIPTTAAIILASVASSLGAMLVAWIVDKASTALFGDKWGPLVGAIFTTVLTLGLSAGSLTEAIELLSNSNTWLALGAATSTGISNYMDASARELAEDAEKMWEMYGEMTAEVERKTRELMSNSGIDLSIVSRYIDELKEEPEHFLQRTLMTGSDIVELTLEAIENFADNRLKLE